MKLQRMGMIVAGLILSPAAGWFSAPYMALSLAANCQVKTLNVFHEAQRDVITQSHWWFSPGLKNGTGTYTAEIRYIAQDGSETIKNIVRSYQLKYTFNASHWQVETERVTLLSGESDFDNEVERYVDPLVKRDFTAPIMIFKLPGNNYMLGINDRPRTFCQPAR